MSQQTKLKVFLDNVGRTIIGEEIKSLQDPSKIKLKDPVFVNIVPDAQTGRISLQLLPLFFREFLADASESVIWSWPRATIVEADDIHLDFKVLAQYQQIFTFAKQPVQPQPAQVPQQTNVVKLFDN